MSRTINTNPYRVRLADRRSHYSGTLLHYGGWNSFGRNAKPLRKQLERQVRRHVNDTLHLMVYIELDDIIPKRQMRRQVSWMLG